MDNESETSYSDCPGESLSEPGSDIIRDLGLGVGYSEEEEDERWADAESDPEGDYYEDAAGELLSEASDSGAEGDVDCTPGAAWRQPGEGAGGDCAGDDAGIGGFLASATSCRACATSCNGQREQQPQQQPHANSYSRRDWEEGAGRAL